MYLSTLHKQGDEVAVLAIGYVEDHALLSVGLELDSKVRSTLRDERLVELQVGLLLRAEPQAGADSDVGVGGRRYRQATLAESSGRCCRRLNRPAFAGIFGGCDDFVVNLVSRLNWLNNTRLAVKIFCKNKGQSAKFV